MVTVFLNNIYIHFAGFFIDIAQIDKYIIYKINNYCLILSEKIF